MEGNKVDGITREIEIIDAKIRHEKKLKLKAIENGVSEEIILKHEDNVNTLEQQKSGLLQ